MEQWTKWIRRTKRICYQHHIYQGNRRYEAYDSNGQGNQITMHCPVSLIWDLQVQSYGSTWQMNYTTDVLFNPYPFFSTFWESKYLKHYSSQFVRPFDTFLLFRWQIDARSTVFYSQREFIILEVIFQMQQHQSAQNSIVGMIFQYILWNIFHIFCRITGISF